jgi:hypothetical protein
VWEPLFDPLKGDVTVPVQTERGWTLALNGTVIWDRCFNQLWHHRYSVDSQNIAAVVSPEFGKWTVAVNGSPWKRTFSDAVLPPVFSPDGKRVAAIVKDKGKWTIAVDGQPWDEVFDMIWDPHFSPDGSKVAAKAEKNGVFFIVMDGKVAGTSYEACWDPVFSPEGKKILVRAIDAGTYYRRVCSV